MHIATTIITIIIANKSVELFCPIVLIIILNYINIVQIKYYFYIINNYIM